MSKSTRLLAILLAVLMTVSVFPLNVFAATNVITAVDMTGLVTETVFPTGKVTTPVFYDTIPATVDGVGANLPVTWECTTSYNGSVAGIYTFEAVADGYVWECDAPVITVKVVAATLGNAAGKLGFAPTADNAPIPYVIKGVSGKNVAYDATGCNALDSARSTGAEYFAGSHNSVSGAVATVGETHITVTGGANIAAVYGGGYGGTKTHSGITNIYINNATITSVFGGGYGSKATVTGNPYIDVSGRVTIGTICGSGSYSSKVNGTATVNIHDLDTASSITAIKRLTTTTNAANKLIVKLDDTSKHLLSDGNITGVTTAGYTDTAVVVYINDEKFVGMKSVPTDLEVPENIVKDTASEVLPQVEGFTWIYDDSTTGNKVFTLTADEGYFIDGLVKSKSYNVTVTRGEVAVSGVTIEQGDVNLNVGQQITLTATVLPEDATDKTVVWTSNNDAVTVVDGVVTAIAEGTATITATAGGFSDTVEVTVNAPDVITDVDTEGLVMETVFPYSDKINAENRWSNTITSYVEEPTFYPELSVLVEGETEYRNVPVTWVCTTEYDGTETGATYTFVPEAIGYIFANAPVITATIVDAGWGVYLSGSDYSMEGFAIPATTESEAGEPIEFVIKNDDIYDATGCNKLVQDYVVSTRKNVMFYAAQNSSSSGIAGKTVATKSEGTVKVSIEDSEKITHLHGGTYGGTGHTGNVDITVKDSTLTNVFGAGRATALTGDVNIVISGTSTVKAIYGAGWGANADVTGNANIDISGKISTNMIKGGGYLDGASLSGTATVRIHDLEEGWSIGAISKGDANALVVDVDDPGVALEIFSLVSDWTNVTAKINGEKVTVASAIDLSKIEYTVANGTEFGAIGLPTSFEIDGEIVDGFSWEGTYNPTNAGTYTLTLKAPEDVYLVVDIAVTVTVERPISFHINSVTTETARVAVDYGTSLDDAKALLPTQFVANDGAFTVPATAFEWVTEDYKAYIPDEYTFKAVITDGEYKYTDGTEPFKAIVTVKAPATQGSVVTEIKLPVNYTVFTKDTGTVDGCDSQLPVKFYDKLDAVAYENGVRKETQITDIEWEGALTRTDVNGEYWTYSIKSYDNTVSIAPEIIAGTTITAYKTTAEYSNRNGHIRGVGNVVIPVTIVSAEKLPGGVKGNMAIMDATGLNNVYKVITTSAGGTYYGGNTTDVTGNPSVTFESGAGAKFIYLGGNTKSVTGNGTINLKNGSTVSEDVYAGSRSAAFIGDATINIEDGATVIGKIYACGTGTFDGDVVINVANGAKIGGITLGDNQANHPDSVTINVESGFNLSLIECIESDIVKVYVDGILYQQVTKVEMPEKTVVNVALGTEDIGLPSALVATVNGRQGAIDVTWSCENYDANTAGKYIFKPVVSDAYDVSESNIADISVVVRVLTANAGQSVITGFAPIDAVSVTLGTPKEAVVLPSTVTATVNGQSVPVEVDLWTCNGVYDGSVYGAEYTYTATVSGEYALAVSAPTVVVKITKGKIVEIYLPVTETTFPRGTVANPVFYDTLKVKLDNGTVVDMSGFKWTVKDYNKNTLGTYTATITTVPENCEFSPSLSVPGIKVSVINKKYDVFTLDDHIYLNGIPTVIDGDESGTYLYDMTGCNKTDSANIAGKTVFSGGPANSVSLSTTMVEMRGGNIGSIYGGSRNSTRVTDTAYIYVLGGTVGYLYGGGYGGTTTAARAVTGNAYVYAENTNITRISGAGYQGNIEEDTTVIVKNSTVTTIYGSSASSKAVMTVDGKATLKLLDGVKVRFIYGAGRASAVNELEIYLSKNATVSDSLNPTGMSLVTGTAKIFYETGADISKVYTEEDNVRLYEGHFLEDRETFVTDREVKVIRNAGLVRGDYYVDYGTSLENIGLPTTVEGEIEGQLTTVSGITYTPVKNYNENKAGRYEFTLNVPDGYSIPPITMDNAGKITVVVTEPAQNGEITAVNGKDTEFTFANGTALENIGLPTAYTATVSGVNKTVPVKNWNVTDENGRAVTYDRYEAGTYVFTPAFDSRYTVSAELPTHTVKLSAFTATREANTRYLNGIPAEINALPGIVLITDKNGNYLENGGASTVVYGGSLTDDVESTDITMNSGSVTAIYGGSNMRDIKGNVNIVVNGGTVTSLYAGSMKGTLQGSNVVINGGTVTNLYGINGGTVFGRINFVVNGGTVSNVNLGSVAANGKLEGTKQEAEEVLALSTEKDKGPIVVEKDELISAVFVQNGGTVRSLYGAGKGANTSMDGSVKIYINGGKIITICGGGSVQNANTMDNVYIVVSEEAECDTIYANAPGSIYGKAYVVVPEDFNRYNILGWNETDSDISDDTNVDMDDDDAYLDEGYVAAEVIVSGGRYEEDIPVRVLYSGTTQTVYASGVPIKIVGQSSQDEEDEETTNVSTYVWYFDENYNAETETPETFSYETYVDRNGNPLVLTGVWRRIPESLSSGVVIYGGSIQGTADKYPSTYVEINGGTVKGVYAGGKNNTIGTANLVLDAEGSYSTGIIYGGGNNSASQITNKVHIKVLRGSYDIIYAGGYNVTTNSVQVDVEGGSVNTIYMGAYAKAGIVTGTVTLNLTNCTVGTVYGGGFNTSSKTIGAEYINVNENVRITGNVYPKGSGERPDKEKSGAVSREAYIMLNDADSASSQFKKIKYTNAQAHYVYINGVVMGNLMDTSLASFETAEKTVEITNAEASDYRGNRSIVFLNGIPTIVAGDGNGHSYLYQAKTKDGTLNAYQKNEDGTFKYDENGKRISNIVRDSVTGQAIKGSKLVDVDVIDYVVYGGANGKSVEDVYVEFHIGGGMWAFYAGCRGGNAGFDAQGNEVGLVEVRQFGGGPFDELHMGNVLGYDVEGNQTVNVKMTKSVFLGISGGTRLFDLAGLAGTVGSEEKFIDGYYNKAGDVITYTDPDDNQVYEITGKWEEYTLDVTKEDYAEYYESSNAYFNGEDNTDFLDGDFYVDPYDDHYTGYALLGAFSTNHFYFGTYGTEYTASRNRVYGNTYVRQSAYGLKYDAELDMFVEDYNDYLGRFACLARIFDGCYTGVMYGDIRHDHEAVLGPIQPFGNASTGAVNYGHTYINMYETDTNPLLKDELYKVMSVKTASNLTVKQNFFPRWSHASAWALTVDVDMVQLAIDKGYITEVTDPGDVRTSMLSAEDGARLLNYYYTGSFDEFVTTVNEQQTDGYKSVFDASNDLGNFVIRHFEGRESTQKGMDRYLLRSSGHFGDAQLITFPNGETMLIDVGKFEPQTLINDIRYVLEQYKEQGVGDGKTIDYFVITHPHGDHQGNATSVLRTFDIKNLVLPPYDSFNDPAYYAVVDYKSEQYVAEGKDPINIIRVQRGDKLVIGEGDEEVVIDVVNPGDHSYKTFTLVEMLYRIKNGTGSGLYNPCGIGTIFTYKGQRYYSCADIKEDAEQSLMRTYGADYLKCDVMKLSHHGHASSSIYPLMNATNPDVTIQTSLAMQHADASVPVYLANNNTGGYAETLLTTAVTGAVKVVMDGEKITSTAQFKDRAYERDTDEYKNLESNYNALLDRVEDTREALTVVADNATAPYGTAYIWKSHANYIDTQLEELSKRFYSGTMTIDMLEEYTEKLLDLEQFTEDATMYGGSDTTPDVEVPGTDEGGEETTTPGTSGGIIGDVGGGNAGAGIGGGAVVVPEGPSTDDRRFIDVATTDWFNNAVNYVADNNYFRGVSENQFDPNGKMTRAMLVTVIGRMAKADTSEAVNNFTDVEDGSWYAGYVAWAAENGIVTGVGEGKFAPNDNVTREQIAAILMRYATYKGIDVSVDSTEKYDSMKDTASVSEYAVEALKWATANAVINGAEGNINPRGNATRAEVAQMIMNFCNTFSI